MNKLSRSSKCGLVLLVVAFSGLYYAFKGTAGEVWAGFSIVVFGVLPLSIAFLGLLFMEFQNKPQLDWVNTPIQIISSLLALIVLYNFFGRLVF